MPRPYAAVACNLDRNTLLTCLPLFEAEKVEAVEWSFDALYNFREIPSWFTELLQAFSRENRLVGHGVFFSLFSGKWMEAQQTWLTELKKLSATYRFDHITEHFGFMTGADFHAGAPISLPFTADTLAIGRDRLARIYEACECPVGLENLAFAYSLEEVKKHGEFLEQLLGPVNGFIILDLHNLYCQLRNFELEFAELIQLYPLDRVREIHISGGSWEDSPLRPGKPIRRDTHDDAVPQEVFQLLERAIPLCPNLKFVVMEQLGSGLQTAASQLAFQQDFDTMSGIIRQGADLPDQPGNAFLPSVRPNTSLHPLESSELQRQQRQLSEILETAANYEMAKDRLAASDLAQSAWGIESWEPAMLETAMRIAQKWAPKEKVQ